MMSFPTNFLCRNSKQICFILIQLCVGLRYTTAATSQFFYTPNLTEAQKQISCLRIKQALKILDSEALVQPNNIAVDYLFAYANFYQAMVHQNPEFKKSYEVLAAKLLVKLKTLPNTVPLKRTLLARVHLQRAMVKVGFNDYLSAAWDFRSSYLEVQENEKNFPNDIGHKKELGTLMAVIGSFPQQYQWIVSVVGFSGNFEEGLKILHQYAESNLGEPIIEIAQAKITYALIQLNFGLNKKETWDYCNKNTLDYKQNMLSCYLRAFVAGKCGENEMALHTLLERPQSANYEQIAYLNFLLGNYLLNKLDLSAANYFKKYLFLSISKGSLKETYQKLSWIAWFQADTAKFLYYHAQIPKYSKEAGSEWKLLNQDIVNGKFPSTELIKARLYFDGGYFSLASFCLTKGNTLGNLTNFQKMEYKYRLGRIFQEEGKFSEAIKAFQDCINNYPTIQSYMAPNSCLQLGIIYEQLHYLGLAREYYEKISEYSNYDYESSIQQKANTALFRLKK